MGTRVFKDGSVIYLNRDLVDGHGSKPVAKVRINEGVVIVANDLYGIDKLTIYGHRNKIIFDEFQGSEFILNGVDNTLYTSTHSIYGYYDQYHGSVRNFANGTYSARCYKVNMSSAGPRIRLDEYGTKVLSREITSYYKFGAMYAYDHGTDIPDTKLYICDVGGDSILDIFSSAYE
jgi:hypothetical protein